LISRVQWRGAFTLAEALIKPSRGGMIEKLNIPSKHISAMAADFVPLKNAGCHATGTNGNRCVVLVQLLEVLGESCVRCGTLGAGDQ
jgi:hypothetical protein